MLCGKNTTYNSITLQNKGAGLHQTARKAFYNMKLTFRTQQPNLIEIQFL